MTEARDTGALSADPVAASQVSPGAGEPAVATDISRPSKRRKISNACESCRVRKTKCDGGRPICGPCQYRSKSQQSCVYAKDPTTRSGNEEHDVFTRSLIDRIQSLERIIASSSWPQDRQLEDVHPSPRSIREIGVPTATTSQNVSSLGPSEEAVTVRAGHQNPLGDDVPVAVNYGPSPVATHEGTFSAADVENSSSPVNAMGSAAFTGGGSCLPLSSVNEFYGGSSAARFMEQVEETIPSSGQQPSYATRPEASLKPTQHVSKPLGLSLPTRDLADALLENYWVKSYPLYPFVYKPVFTLAYEDLWKPSHELRRGTGECDLGLGTLGVSDSQSAVYHCGLNAIFALSCQLSGPEILHHDRDSLSQTFFLRCKSLLHVDILDHGSIALVQILLIVAQYLQSTSFSSRCWTSLGLACRIGQGLGLHVETRGSRRDGREVELRRRVWHGCTIMDIVASTTLGRPMMTPSRVTIPLPSTSVGSMHEDPDDSSSPFYVESIKLYSILGRIVSTVYSPWSPQGFSSDLEGKENYGYAQITESEAVMSFDEELSNFEEGIVTCLQWGKGTSTVDSLPNWPQHIIKRQTNVLRARYLHVRVILHRPTFLRFCRKMVAVPPPSNDGVRQHSENDENLRSKMDVQSSVVCVTTAIDLISSLHGSTTESCDGAWWYTTFYLCTAASVLMLAKTCLRLHRYISIESIDAAWTLCRESLGILINRGHPVKHALKGLCSMYDKFVGESSTWLLTKPHDSLTELASSGIKETQQVYHNMVSGTNRDPTLGATLPHGGHQDFQGQGSPGGVESSTMQPLLDFMTQDVNLMPFGLIDESWWGLDQRAEAAMGFDD
ncbi:hypothetical protein VE03_03343 [Pseudogymnoascus sp. 23342-1-I1]|nr:hypothetical protein VE03_03343 [Pseudogymnoascus sp. 23342-1-I1]